MADRRWTPETLVPAEGRDSLSKRGPGYTETPGLTRPIMPLRRSTMRMVTLAALLGGCALQGRQQTAYVSSQIAERTDQALPGARESSEPLIPDGVDVEDGLSEREAVAIALWNNARFQAALTELGFARADVVQAGLLANPTFSVLFPLGPKQLEFAATFPLDALWLRPRRVAWARVNEQRVAESLVQSGLDLVRDVEVVYSEAILAGDRDRLTRQAAEVRADLATLAETRLRAGDASEMETAAARVESLRARAEATRTAQAVTVTHERLRALLGLPDLKIGSELNASEYVVPDRDPEELLREALAARPDLRAAELGIETAGKRAGLARAEVIALSGILDANGSGDEGFESGPGLQLPLPVFNRGQGTIVRAEAELERAVWNYAALRNQIALEVRESHAMLRRTHEDLVRWRTAILPALEQSVAQAQKSYEVGEESPLLVLESTGQLLGARVREAEVAADYRRARAELERNVGHRLDVRGERGQ